MNGMINNDWDRDNLMFLLNLGTVEYHDWQKQSDEDDLVYAQELLNAYSLELDEKSRELRVEAELALLFDYKEAMEVINKVKYA